jgi:DNA-binding CsgD family transcriptional regulator
MRARDLLEQGLELYREIGDVRGIAYSLRALADLARDTRAHSRALELASQALEQFDALHESWGSLWGLLAVGLARQGLGDTEAAVRLFGAAESLGEVAGVPVSESLPQWDAECLPTRSHARSALGAEKYERALAVGRAMSRQQAIAYALGPAPTHELPHLAVRPAADRNGPLSHREQEVAALVAQALTNREIAERLVVSVRTVEAHVAHIRDKLALRSRVQVATWAADDAVEHARGPSTNPG